jgi:hypothetical protein
MWEYNSTTQSIFRIILAMFMVVFIFTIVFDFYLLAASKKIIEQARTVKEEMKTAKVAIDFGNGTKRAFEGEVSNTGLTLYELLMTVGEVGDVDIKFTTSTGNGMTVEAIGDNLNNKDGHNWLVVFPSLGWSKPINEIGLDSVVLTGGGTAKLVYR